MSGADLQAQLEQLRALCKQVTDPTGAKAMAAMAASTEGREKLQATLAEVRTAGAAGAEMTRLCAKATAAIEKALRKKRWGFRA